MTKYSFSNLEENVLFIRLTQEIHKEKKKMEEERRRKKYCHHLLVRLPAGSDATSTAGSLPGLMPYVTSDVFDARLMFLQRPRSKMARHARCILG